MNFTISTLKITTEISAVVLGIPLSASATTFLDLDGVTPGTPGTGAFTGTLGGVSVTGSLLSGGNPAYSINAIGATVADSVIDDTSPQYSDSNIYTPFEPLTDQVGYAKNPTSGTAILEIEFSEPVTNPIFHVANQDRIVYDFAPSGLTLGDLTLLSGNGGNGDGLALDATNPWIVHANPNTLAGIPPNAPPPIAGPRSAYGSVQLNGTFTTLTINLISNPANTSGDGGSFTISLDEDSPPVPESSPLAMLGAVGTIAMGTWRGDKNYQTKAGQAFQGVELKKIEG